MGAERERGYFEENASTVFRKSWISKTRTRWMSSIMTPTSVGSRRFCLLPVNWPNRRDKHSTEEGMNLLSMLVSPYVVNGLRS